MIELIVHWGNRYLRNFLNKVKLALEQEHKSYRSDQKQIYYNKYEILFIYKRSKLHVTSHSWNHNDNELPLADGYQVKPSLSET